MYLATAHRLLGNAGEAIRLGEAVVAARERVLGAEHPDTFASRLGVGLAYADAYAVPQAVAVLTAALADAEKAHDPGRRSTVEIRASLGCCLALSGELGAAVREYDRAIADAAEHFGADHPETVALREERHELSAPDVPEPRVGD